MRGIAVLLLLAAAAASGEEAFTFLDRGGEPIAVRPAPPESGHTLLLHFWATWCPECVDDLARLAEVSSGCDRVSVMAIDAGDRQADVAAFVERHGVRLRVLRDPKGEAWRKLDGRGLPMNAWWSASGSGTELGPKTREQWRALFASLGCPG